MPQILAVSAAEKAVASVRNRAPLASSKGRTAAAIQSDALVRGRPELVRQAQRPAAPALPAPLQGLDPKRAEVFLSLSRPQQDKFVQLWTGLEDLGKEAGPVRTKMKLMLDAKFDIARRLGDRDKDGRDTLDNLLALHRTPLAGGLPAHKVMGEAIDIVREPGAVIDQSNRGTCAATSVEYIIATKNPAELVRMIAGVASPAGVTTLRDGARLERVADSLAPDSSSRTNVDRLLQAALMDLGNGPFLKYDNNQDDGKAWRTYTGEGGLMNGQMGTLLRHITGKKFDSDLCLIPGWGQASTARRVEAAVKRGEMVPISMEFKPEQGRHFLPQGHALTAVGFEYGPGGKPTMVLIRNPWGSWDDDPKGTDGPPRKAVDMNGTISMDYEMFLKRLRGAVIPL